MLLVHKNQRGCFFVFFTSHVGNVGVVPASDEVGVEVDHDHAPVVSLERSVRVMHGVSKGTCVSTVHTSKVTTTVSTCSILKVTQKGKLKYRNTGY